jgi:NitT/TauT family transport system permease protein
MPSGAYPVAAAALVLLAWQWLVTFFEVPRYLLPSPMDIGGVIGTRFDDLLDDTAITLLEAIAGFLIGSTSAFFVGVVFAIFYRIERALSPLFVALQAVPLIAIAPLLIVWMGNGFASKVTMAALICFFPMVVTTTAGLTRTAASSEELMTALGSSVWQRFILLRLPQSVPFLMAGLKVNASYAVIGAIVSELAGAGRGIGFQILMASYKTDTPMLFAAIFMAAISGIGFFKVVEFVESRLSPRFGAT